MDDVLKKFDEMTNRVQFSDYIMPYGKYQGEFIADINIEDQDYLFWLMERLSDDDELKRAIRYHIEGE